MVKFSKHEEKLAEEGIGTLHVFNKNHNIYVLDIKFINAFIKHSHTCICLSILFLCLPALSFG